MSASAAALGAYVCAVLPEPAPLDLHAWRCWCAGLSEAEAARAALAAQGLGGDAFPLALRDVAASYRVFAQLETALLADPSAAVDGAGWPALTHASPELAAAVGAFYTPHLAVLRALLGKQLTSKLRASLDDVAEAAGCRLREALRTFDTLKAAFVHIEDADVPPPLYATLRTRFRLGPELAWLLACALFLLSYRFNVPGGGGARPQQLRSGGVPTDALLDVASAMLLHWGDSSVPAAGAVPLPPAAAPLPAHHPPRPPTSAARHASAVGFAPQPPPPSAGNHYHLLPPASAPGRELTAVIAGAGSGASPHRSLLLLRASSSSYLEPLPPIAEGGPGGGGSEHGGGGGSGAREAGDDSGDGGGGGGADDDDGGGVDDEDDDGSSPGGAGPHASGGGGHVHHAHRRHSHHHGHHHHGHPAHHNGGGHHPHGRGGGGGWEPSPGASTSFDPAFIAAIRDICGRMLRSKADRGALTSAVLVGFIAAMAGSGGGGDDQAPSPSDADSVTGGGSGGGGSDRDSGSLTAGGGGRSAGLAARAAVLARRLEPRLPALLGALRDIGLTAISSSSAEVRGLLEDVASKLAAPLAEVPLAPAEVAALFTALLSPEVTALVVTAAAGPAAAASAALQWRRFVAVVAFAVDRMMEPPVG